MEPIQNVQKTLENSTNDDLHPPVLSKNAQKKLLKQQRFEANKLKKKAAIKEQKQRKAEQKHREWEEKLASISEEEKTKLIQSQRELKRERMEKASEEREKKIERLTRAKEEGQKIIIDLEFSDLMTPNEIHSLVQQIMYCYAVNGKSPLPGHLWLTGCSGDIETQLQRLPGFDKWMIEKESRSYVEALQDQKDNLVYLTADAETVLDELDPKQIYIIGGLVDRNRWKGLTKKKAQDQGIQTAKLPIGNYLKMSSSQVLTVNQVVEILLKFLETRDWKTSFFHVIPQRKRHEAEAEVGEQNEEDGSGESKKKCIEQSSTDEGNLST
ncbi:hypothetical protein NE237_032905 [Protea cynaroides]|uniref:tRNA (guanine(9)-N(1))-methyltransferase n=1 Tax=Protea cynaroides TaxID=273540 RepID=A0A9Q0L3W0_9MAGN|nr:hypothetical protein NE237_032905 [Protea cynaroides]